MKEQVKLAANAMIGLNDITLKGEIVVFGSTYMANFPLYQLINKYRFENAVYNRSINELTIEEALEIVRDCIVSISPGKVFISLGEEDEGNDNAIRQYNEIVKILQTSLPNSKLYLIGLHGGSPYVKKFNDNILSLCDDKKVHYIQFVSPALSDTDVYKARFKQLSCFFSNKPLNMVEAFAMAD